MTANKRGDQLIGLLISPEFHYDVKTFHEKMESLLGYRLWRLGNFYYFILKGNHHKIIKKPQDAA
jgi:hypothetical protein